MFLFRKISRKLLFQIIFLSTLLYTLLIISKSISRVNLLSSQLNLEKTIRWRFKTWANDFLFTTYDLDSEQIFNQEFEKIKRKKIQNDIHNKYWYINEERMNNLPLSVNIPKYFYDNNIERPIIQPFDARMTIGIYLKYIKEYPGRKVPFHWSDWLDFSPLNKYLFTNDKPNCDIFKISDGEKSLSTYCSNVKNGPLNFKIHSSPGRQTQENFQVMNKGYLLLSAKSPVKLVFMTASQGSFEVEVSDFENNNLDNTLSKNGITEYLINDNKIDKSINVLDIYNELVESSKRKDESEEIEFEINIPQESFDVNNTDVIIGLEENKDLSVSESLYLDSLKFSESNNYPPKYFYESLLPKKHKNYELGTHYDWRFFNNLIEIEDQSTHLHRLIKNYLNFARQYKLITWIAHGSLLAWYWNGVSFPWDADVDVQMPIGELHRLSRYHNQTLVIENTGTKDKYFDGLGRYFIDVGSTITHRTKENGMNNIDARFIDIDTGLYIDITGLALTHIDAPSRLDYIIESDPKKKKIVQASTDKNELVSGRIRNKELQVYNCRNHHFSLYSELSPLIYTLVENQPTYIPSNFILLLNNEYKLKSLTEKNFWDYIYLKNFRIWVTTQVVLDYINDPQLFSYNHNFSLKDHNSEIEIEIEKEEEEEMGLDNEKHAKPSLYKRLVGILEKQAINQLSLEDHINLLHDDFIFQEYYYTRECTKFHENEIKHIFENGIFKFDLDSKNPIHVTMGKPMRPDIFISKVYQSNLVYDTKIDEVISSQNTIHENRL